MAQDDDLETWLLGVGDAVLNKQAQSGVESLSDLEFATYNLWVIDYSVRNSGTLEAARDLQPTAVTDLFAFASTHVLPAMSFWLSSNADEDDFCDHYHEHFDEVCRELRGLWRHCEP